MTKILLYSPKRFSETVLQLPSEHKRGLVRGFRSNLANIHLGLLEFRKVGSSHEAFLFREVLPAGTKGKHPGFCNGGLQNGMEATNPRRYIRVVRQRSSGSRSIYSSSF